MGDSITREAGSQAQTGAASFCGLCRAGPHRAHPRAQSHTRAGDVHRTTHSRARAHTETRRHTGHIDLCTQRQQRCGEMRAHKRRSSADPRNPGAQTRPGFLPPPPPHLTCRTASLPGAVSRPKQIPADKDTAFEPEPSPGL